MKTLFFALLASLVILLSVCAAFVQVYIIDPFFSFVKKRGAAIKVQAVSIYAVISRQWMLSWINLQQLYRCSTSLA